LRNLKKRSAFRKTRKEGSRFLNQLFPMKTIIEKAEAPIRTSRVARQSGTPLGRALQIKTILVPLDFSRASIQALKYAIPFGKEFGAAIHLVHVQPTN
jgi:hypothetical protein